MKHYLQVKPDGVRQDSNGYYLIPLPILGYIQDEKGKPTTPTGYFSLEIKELKPGVLQIIVERQ